MKILNSEESDFLRSEYIQTFVNTNSTFYAEYIENKQMFSDGLCYTGYLWDCLLSPNVISEYKADMLLLDKQNVFIMWDIHSCDRIHIPNYWKYPKPSVLFADCWSEVVKSELPEDIYVFDEALSWSVIYTHETNAKERRYCLYTKGGYQAGYGKIEYNRKETAYVENV